MSVSRLNKRKERKKKGVIWCAEKGPERTDQELLSVNPFYSTKERKCAQETNAKKSIGLSNVLYGDETNGVRRTQENSGLNVLEQ